MLIEVKAKVSWVKEDGKSIKKVNTFLVDKEFFSEAEYTVTEYLNTLVDSKQIEEFYITSLKESSIKEIYTKYQGDNIFIATLVDVFIDDKGKEKLTKYKVLLWSKDLTDANKNVNDLTSQGYDMRVEGIKQVEHIYLQS